VSIYEDFLDSEVTVICEHCGSVVPLADADEIGERIGPDLIPYPVYECFACAGWDYIDEDESFITHVASKEK
jgi:hypothetical protein